ncbi:MAG: Holliday junction resolvase RuvX [Marinilabiliales bacterium]|nr:MAG: Holliday junction resolvase RuvX [Marinilabiliales bacterium]
MGRILALDYGQKRTGIAVTDNEKIIATGLTTIPSKTLLKFIGEYIKNEEVECIVIGEPKDMMNRPSDSTKYIEPFIGALRKRFPKIVIKRYDERFTSNMAFQAMIDGGLSKSKRRDKAMVDKISATLILQSYLKSVEKN